MFNINLLWNLYLAIILIEVGPRVVYSWELKLSTHALSPQLWAMSAPGTWQGNQTAALTWKSSWEGLRVARLVCCIVCLQCLETAYTRYALGEERGQRQVASVMPATFSGCTTREAASWGLVLHGEIWFYPKANYSLIIKHHPSHRRSQIRS